jgi:hypothetical protein
VTDDKVKATPRGAPPSAAGDQDSRAVGITDEESERIKVRLSIHGGIASERFDLDLAASGEGEMQFNLACALSKRRIDTVALRIEPRRLADMLKFLARPTSALYARRGGFPPCSLIGRLEVDVGGKSNTLYFMADQEQAKTAGYEPPDEVMRVVEMLYREAEAGLGIDSVRP